jgi:hypothetical protein
MIKPTPPSASAVMALISFGVGAPASSAIPSHVAALTNRLDNAIPLIAPLSNNLLILSPSRQDSMQVIIYDVFRSDLL